VGSSMGGGVAIDSALSSPGRFAGLVLLAPAVSGEREGALGLDPDPVTDELFDQLRAAYQAGDAAAANRWHARIWLDGPHQPEGRVSGAPRELALAMNDVILHHELAEGALPEDEAGGSGVDAWHRLGELSLPVTVGCGELDVPELVHLCRWLAEQVSRARFRPLTGTAHLPYLDRPELVADVVREALAG
jgi:pimeloyl-ACP methyl ester carboxylesterase